MQITSINQWNKKRPNTIPVSGPGKWLLQSRALKVGIFAGEVALPFKGSLTPRIVQQPRINISVNAINSVIALALMPAYSELHAAASGREATYRTAFAHGR